MDKDFIVNIPFTTNQIDVILNALEEKNIAIKELYNSIYNMVYEQIEPYLKTNKVREEEENMESKMIVCKDCGKEFEYTAGEQKFFEEKGFTAPIRCKDCRAAKKARNEAKEQPKNDLEEMLKKFQENTVTFK